MTQEENPEYVICIEYDDFLTRFDLDEVLTSIDGIIEEKVFDYLDPEFHFLRRRFPYKWPFWVRGEPELSYLGIKSIEQGSITLGVFIGGAVVGYVAHRFKKGVDASLFAEELQRSGRLTGDVFGSLLQRINNWAERYVPKQQELGGKVKKITARRKTEGKDGTSNKS